MMKWGALAIEVVATTSQELSTAILILTHLLATATMVPGLADHDMWPTAIGLAGRPPRPSAIFRAGYYLKHNIDCTQRTKS